MIAIEIPMKSQPYDPHINQYTTDRNKRGNSLILMVHNPNQGWDFHVPPDCRIIKPNLSSTIHPCTIFQAYMWDLIEHINPKPSKDSKGHPTQTINNDFTPRLNNTKPSSDWSLPKPLRASRVFVLTKASMNSNSTHSCCRASKAFV